ncbi:hypothetical protein IFT90_02620 [Frigoribacterium sp. CFBP 8766]|uniref:hypothetical protein n=1 Tax=Frigoribacterium sp. CFBP 8766 TaxID=2775273 RepID=UPI00177EFC31|nr:hypothetical protein [Frigoribacterium sp. CFBP 8766]MBD8583449.1 hypothetical protein [Frigoribacterium sp. CFBP 8766]
MNTTILRPSGNTALERYWEDYSTLPESGAVLYPPAATAVRFVRLVELETALVDTPLAHTMRVQATGLPHEAAVRMAIWNARGELASMDGWDVAARLQDQFFPHSHRASLPWRGMDLLRAVDLTSSEHGATVTVAAPPATSGDRPQLMRLADRVAQLTAAHL